MAEDSVEGFLANARAKNDLIKELQNAPEDSYLITIVFPGSGCKGKGRIASFAPKASMLELYGLYDMLRTLLGMAQESVFDDMIGGDDAETEA